MRAGTNRPLSSWCATAPHAEAEGPRVFGTLPLLDAPVDAKGPDEEVLKELDEGDERAAHEQACQA